MAITKIYNGTVQTDIINISEDIGDATAIFIVVPDNVDDYSFEFFLQLKINSFDNRRIRLTEDIVELDTTLVVFIPKEYQYINLSKYFAIITSFPVALEVYAITPEKSVDSDNIEEILNVINQAVAQLSQVQTVQALQSVNAVAQNTALIALAGGVGITAAPLTGGTSLALPAGISEVLLPASASLSGLLVGI